MGIITNHYKDPFFDQPGILRWEVRPWERPLRRGFAVSSSCSAWGFFPNDCAGKEPPQRTSAKWMENIGKYHFLRQLTVAGFRGFQLIEINSNGCLEMVDGNGGFPSFFSIIFQS